MWFGEGTSGGEVIRVRLSHEGEALVMGLVFFIRRERELNIFLRHEQPGGKAMWGHREKLAIHKSGKELSLGPKLDSTLIWDSPASSMF